MLFLLLCLKSYFKIFYSKYRVLHLTSSTTREKAHA
jgi:hypothetical protein